MTIPSEGSYPDIQPAVDEMRSDIGMWKQIGQLQQWEKITIKGHTVSVVPPSIVNSLYKAIGWDTLFPEKELQDLEERTLKNLSIVVLGITSSDSQIAKTSDQLMRSLLNELEHAEIGLAYLTKSYGGQSAQNVAHQEKIREMKKLVESVIGGVHTRDALSDMRDILRGSASLNEMQVGRPEDGEEAVWLPVQAYKDFRRMAVFIGEKRIADPISCWKSLYQLIEGIDAPTDLSKVARSAICISLLMTQAPMAYQVRHVLEISQSPEFTVFGIGSCPFLINGRNMSYRLERTDESIKIICHVDMHLLDTSSERDGDSFGYVPVDREIIIPLEDIIEFEKQGSSSGKIIIGEGGGISVSTLTESPFPHLSVKEAYGEFVPEKT